ncbi:MAG: hypothetical protein LUH05_02995 [Candidatus Gastranaerophilales bacterium]|nr:hypothetical protein [Candidatus Gastranaerophilales bacterium]
MLDEILKSIINLLTNSKGVDVQIRQGRERETDPYITTAHITFNGFKYDKSDKK